jgi:bla regulator protein BlaR1
MWEMSFQVAILVAVLLVISFVLRSRSARLHHSLWLIALIRLVVPPWLAAPTSLRWWFGEPMLIDGAAAGVTPPAELNSLPVPSGFDSELATLPATSVLQLDSWNLALAETLLLVWAAVVVARLYVLLLGLIRVRRWISHSSGITDTRVHDAFDRARKRVSAPATISLRCSDQCGTPVVVGVINPVVLIPSTVMETLDQEELESVFVHECLHVVRRDGWVQIAQAILTQFYFFHPAVWVLNTCIRRTCEQACDEQTIEAMEGRRKPYASAIVKTADTLVDKPRQFAIGMIDSAYPIRARLKRLLDPKLPLNRGGSVARFFVTLLIALVTLPSGARSNPAGVSVNLPPQRMLAEESVEGAPDSERASIPSEPLALRAATDTVIDQLPDSQADLPHPPSEPTPPETAPDQFVLEEFVLEQRTAGLAALRSIDFRERMAGYAELEKIGSTESIDILEQAFLSRSGVECDAAKRSLDAVWARVRATQTSESFHAGNQRVH